MKAGHTILINGTWHAAAGGATLPVVDPSTGVTWSALSRGEREEVDEAVCAARTAFRTVWRRRAPAARGRILMELSRLIRQNRDRLAEAESRDVGKPLRQARADMVATARYAEFYGGAADKLHGETLPYEPGYTVMVVREPCGVTGHIIPWNYPAQMFGRSVLASLAAGNAVVVKPAEDACQSVLMLAELALEAGVPPGVLNVVTGYGDEAGAALAAHPDVDHHSFTGSPATGTRVQQAAAIHNRPVTMELGGKSPQIVFADADLEALLPVLYNAIVQNAGQTCSAGSRLLIEASCFDEVVGALADRFKRTRMGPALDDPDCGPLISAQQAQRVHELLDQAAGEPGGHGRLELLAEAALPADPAFDGGFYVPPRIYAPVAEDHPLAQEEIFGPVLVATPFRNEAHALELANGTPYGLVAGLWTRDGGRQLRMAHALESGQVFVNTYGAGGGVELPFGGVKRSGFGREKGMEGLRSFTHLKTIAIHHG
jgi:aldehyde dehydrogenase (NAD+)